MCDKQSSCVIGKSIYELKGKTVDFSSRWHTLFLSVGDAFSHFAFIIIDID